VDCFANRTDDGRELLGALIAAITPALEPIRALLTELYDSPSPNLAEFLYRVPTAVTGPGDLRRMMLECGDASLRAWAYRLRLIGPPRFPERPPHSPAEQELLRTLSRFEAAVREDEPYAPGYYPRRRAGYWLPSIREAAPEGADEPAGEGRGAELPQLAPEYTDFTGYRPFAAKKPPPEFRLVPIDRGGPTGLTPESFIRFAPEYIRPSPEVLRSLNIPKPPGMRNRAKSGEAPPTAARAPPKARPPPQARPAVQFQCAPTPPCWDRMLRPGDLLELAVEAHCIVDGDAQVH
jgi:hypothetical protein